MTDTDSPIRDLAREDVWAAFRIASDGTHHLWRGRPVYDARFEAVLAFHPPGLAPVRAGGAAWHVDPAGRAVYPRRFRQAFGFYEGRAAVESDDGWHHVLPDGADLYPERYAWGGNYQKGRVTVRRNDGRYWHLDIDGRPAYTETWRYAGDFREGAAVVQGDNGFSTHVDPQGRCIHGRWFVDLDVYHKGFARARDSRGWTHVDRSGRPLYERRFAMVEPFYNGQARVERADGALEVIGESGRTLVVLRKSVEERHA